MHIHTYRPIPPCCHAWHQLPSSQMVMRAEEIQKETNTGRVWQQLMPWVYIMSTHSFISLCHIPWPKLYTSSSAIQSPMPPFHPSSTSASTDLSLLDNLCPKPNLSQCHDIQHKFWPFSHPSFPSNHLAIIPAPSQWIWQKNLIVADWLLKVLKKTNFYLKSILTLTSCMPQMKAKVHLPLQHPMVTVSLSPVVHVVKKLWVTPKSPAGTSKSKSPRAPEVRLAGCPGRSAGCPGSGNRAQPLYPQELRGIKSYYFIQMEGLLTG